MSPSLKAEQPCDQQRRNAAAAAPKGPAPQVPVPEDLAMPTLSPEHQLGTGTGALVPSEQLKQRDSQSNKHAVKKKKKKSSKRKHDDAEAPQDGAATAACLSKPKKAKKRQKERCEKPVGSASPAEQTISHTAVCPTGGEFRNGEVNLFNEDKDLACKKFEMELTSFSGEGKNRQLQTSPGTKLTVGDEAGASLAQHPGGNQLLKKGKETPDKEINTCREQVADLAPTASRPLLATAACRSGKSSSPAVLGGNGSPQHQPDASSLSPRWAADIQRLKADNGLGPSRSPTLQQALGVVVNGGGPATTEDGEERASTADRDLNENIQTELADGGLRSVNVFCLHLCSV